MRVYDENKEEKKKKEGKRKNDEEKKQKIDIKIEIKICFLSWSKILHNKYSEKTKHREGVESKEKKMKKKKKM